MAIQSRPIAISAGEPAGIGADLILALYREREQHQLPPFLVYGNLDFLGARAQRLGLSVELTGATPDNAVKRFANALPVFDIGEFVVDQPGAPDIAGGQMVMDAIIGATGDCLTGACRGLVTAPIHKAALKRIGFEYPGHTEFLAHLCAGGGEAPTPIMMLAHKDLRVVPLTIHVALTQVPGLINTQMIVCGVRIIANDLRTRFGIVRPQIALTGLNPHAGEESTMGLEERDEIEPAIAQLKREGINAHGPFPADTAFHLPNWQQYDVVVAMYHDQALIPIKTVAFDDAVNVTLGLPIIRTSPDHGTAFDLAGSGKASAKSMLAAIRLADTMDHASDV